MAMEKIEQAIEEKKWRLLDLFKDLDKNKDWKLHREDFLREYAKGNLEVSEGMLDELLMAYGNFQNLDYKNLVKGRSCLLSDRRRQIKGKLIIKNKILFYLIYFQINDF